MSSLLRASALAVTYSALAAVSAAAQDAPAGTQPTSTPLAAPTMVAAPAAIPADSAERLLEHMRSELRQLAVAQEAFYMDHGTYTTDLAALGMLPTREQRRAGPVLAVVFAGGRGWTAMATNRALRGRRCVMFVGVAADIPRLPTTAADGRTPSQEGSPLCDEAR